MASFHPQWNSPNTTSLHGATLKRGFTHYVNSLAWEPPHGLRLPVGDLTGKYNTGIPEDSRFAVEGYEWLRDDITPSKLARVAALLNLAQGLAAPQLSLRWLGVLYTPACQQ